MLEESTRLARDRWRVREGQACPGRAEGARAGRRDRRRSRRRPLARRAREPRSRAPTPSSTVARRGEGGGRGGRPLTIVYASGATGPPKGCVLTHRNWCSMVDRIVRVPRLVELGGRIVLHLPLAHVFARLVELLAHASGLRSRSAPIGRARQGPGDRSPNDRPQRAARLRDDLPEPPGRIRGGKGVRRWLVDRALAMGREASRRLCRRRAGG